MKRQLTFICVSLLLFLSYSDARVPSQYAKQSAQWLRSSEGRRIADNFLTWQTPHGSWPKNRDTASEPFDGKLESIRRDDGRKERWLVPDPDAPPLWARFYELGTNRPLYLDRDSVFRYDFTEISYERRSGYSYHGTWAAKLLADGYPRWREKHRLPKE